MIGLTTPPEHVIFGYECILTDVYEYFGVAIGLNIGLNIGLRKHDNNWIGILIGLRKK